MPRKDGTPTSAERKDAERIANNERFIATATTEQLRQVREPGINDEWDAKIDAEIAQRGES